MIHQVTAGTGGGIWLVGQQLSGVGPLQVPKSVAESGIIGCAGIAYSTFLVTPESCTAQYYTCMRPSMTDFKWMDVGWKDGTIDTC
jgi:hypothetical protein